MKGVGRNPFRILGVSPSASYETIKKAFTKLALQHHPDTAKTSSSEEFIILRKAYERIRDGTYLIDSREEVHRTRTRSSKAQPRTEFSEAEFLEHLYQQTGTRISSAQRRELIQLDSSRIPGATYNGPGWDFARRVAIEQELFTRHRNEFYPERENTNNKNGTQSSSEFKTDNNQSGSKTDTSQGNLRRKRRR